MASYIARRKFLATLLGGTAVAWPLAARAQQPAMPVIGFLGSSAPVDLRARDLTAFRQGVRESGYVEGRNLVIEYRWAGNQADRLSTLAADLVQLRPAVIVTAGLPKYPPAPPRRDALQRPRTARINVRFAPKRTEVLRCRASSARRVR